LEAERTCWRADWLGAITHTWRRIAVQRFRCCLTRFPCSFAHRQTVWRSGTPYFWQVWEPKSMITARCSEKTQTGTKQEIANPIQDVQ